jgi:hypothetical protein
MRQLASRDNHGKQTSKKEKNNHIQDVSDSFNHYHAGTEYDYHRHFGGKTDHRDAAGIFGQYDEPFSGKQESHPAK